MQPISVPCLNDFANSYAPCTTGMVADCLFPPIKVKGNIFQTRLGNKTDAFKVTNDLASCSTQLREVGTTAGALDTPKELELHGLSYPMPNCDYNSCCNNENFDQEAEALKYLISKLTLQKEYNYFNILQSAANYSAGNYITLAAAAQFNLTTSNPIQTIQAAISNIYPQPNTMVLGTAVMQALVRHPQFVGSLPYAGQGVLSFAAFEAAIKNYFPSITKVCIADSRIDTAPTGLAATLIRPYDKQIVLLHNSLGFNSATCPEANYSFTAVKEQGWIVNRVQADLQFGISGGYYLQVGQFYRPVILDNTLGSIITNAVL